VRRKKIDAMNLDYIKKIMVVNWKVDVVEMKEWCGMDRQRDGSNASTSFILNKSLVPLGNKVRKCLKKARSQCEKIRGPSRERTHHILLAQEDHCSQLSIVCCWR
jgi:hypothetical protein